MTPLPPGIRMMLPWGAFGRNNTAFEPPILTVSSAQATPPSTTARAAATTAESHAGARQIFMFIVNFDVGFVITIPILMMARIPSGDSGRVPSTCLVDAYVATTHVRHQI
jgi:hypothetical protein